MKKLLVSVSVFAVFLTGVSNMTSAAGKDQPRTVTKLKSPTPASPDPVQYKPPQEQNTNKVAAKKPPQKGLGLEISGTTSTTFYMFETKQREPNNGKGRGTHLAVDDSRLNFEVFGKASKDCLGGLEYSFLIGLSGSAEVGENPVQENRIKLKGEWGTFLAGDTRGPTDFMAVGAFYFIGGTGGITGNFREVINETTGSVIRDDLLNRFTPKDQTKIIYITPRVYGIQAGYSFTPDGSHKGEQNLQSHTPTSSGFASVVSGVRFAGVNFHEFAVNYKDSYLTCIDVSLSATGIIGKMRDLRRTLSSPAAIAAGVNQDNYPFPRRHMKAFALGGVVEYSGISLGGEYLNNLKSGQLTALKGADLGKVYTVGVGYKQDCNAVSLSYMYTKRQLGRLSRPTGDLNFGHTKFNNTALTFDHELAPGLVFYAEGVVFKMDASQPGNLQNWNVTQNGFSDPTVGPNRGQAGMTGFRIKF